MTRELVKVIYPDGRSAQSGYGDKSTLGEKIERVFFTGDYVKISHPNSSNKQHRDKTGVIMNRVSLTGKIYVSFDDGFIGLVDPVTLVKCEPKI